MKQETFKLVCTPYGCCPQDEENLDNLEWLLDEHENEDCQTYANRIESFEEADKLLEQMKRFWQRYHGWESTYGVFLIIREQDEMVIHMETTQNMPNPYTSS